MFLKGKNNFLLKSFDCIFLHTCVFQIKAQNLNLLMHHLKKHLTLQSNLNMVLISYLISLESFFYENKIV